MKTAGKENQNFCAAAPSNRVHGAAGQEQILLNDVGCESRKIPAAGEVFFLDFPFYRTYQELSFESPRNDWAGHKLTTGLEESR